MTYAEIRAQVVAKLGPEAPGITAVLQGGVQEAAIDRVPSGRRQCHAPVYGFRLTPEQVRRIARPSATTLTWRRVRMRCPSCGFTNGEGMLFCGRCGTKLGFQEQWAENLR